MPFCTAVLAIWQVLIVVQSQSRDGCMVLLCAYGSYEGREHP